MTNKPKNDWSYWIVGFGIIGVIYYLANTPPGPQIAPSDNFSSSAKASYGGPLITQELRKSMNQMMKRFDIPWEPENISAWGHRLNNATRNYPWVSEREIVDCMIVNKADDPKWQADEVFAMCTELMARQ